MVVYIKHDGQRITEESFCENLKEFAEEYAAQFINNEHQSLIIELSTDEERWLKFEIGVRMIYTASQI